MSDYTRHAHKRTVVAEFQRILLDRFMLTDTEPKETLVCEEVFYSEREVVQEALQEILEDLQTWESNLRGKMGAYTWRRENSPLEFLKDEKPATKPTEAKKDGSEAPARKARIRKQRKSEPGGSGNDT